LVGLQPDIILTGGDPATVAVQRETRTIPIVFASVADPVASGLVARLDRPSGNATGFSTREASMGGKWLELLSEIAPGLRRAAIMFNPDTAPVSAYMPSFETAARSLKVGPIIAPVRSDVEIETAIIALGREPGGGLVVMPDNFTALHRAPIILGAARNNVPAVASSSTFARDGGLLSYGPDLVDDFRRAATYVDRILRGAKPGDLPVQFPTKFEPRRLALPSPHRSWCAPTRSSNNCWLCRFVALSWLNLPSALTAAIIRKSRPWRSSPRPQHAAAWDADFGSPQAAGPPSAPAIAFIG
jgi:putative ABC transport system substrate-binding protein